MPIQIRTTWLAILLTATCASWAQEEPGPADSAESQKHVDAQETPTDQPAPADQEKTAKQFGGLK